jgi:hypothetical protein
MLIGRSPWLIASLALAVSSTACETPEPTGCGRHSANNGEIRFCAADGTQVCICQTERCAKHVENTVCPSTLQYVYGGECVPDAEVLPNLDPSNTSMMCDDTSGPHVAEPIGLEEGLAPRYVPFGDGVLVEALNPPDLPADQRDVVWFRQVGWIELQDLVGRVTFDPALGSNSGLTPAVQYASCSTDVANPVALFGHWRRDTGWPVILQVRMSDASLAVEDITTAVMGVPADPQVRSFRIVQSDDGCFVAWTTEAVTATGIPSTLHVAYVHRLAGINPSALTVTATDQWQFHALGGVGSGGEEATDELMAIPDNTGGLIAAVAVLNPAAAEAALLGGRWDAAGMQNWTGDTGGGRIVMHISDTDGIESMYRNVAAVVDSTIAVAVVAIESGTGDRLLHYGRADVESGTPDGFASIVPDGRGTERIPSLVALPDSSVHVAVSTDWSGEGGGPGAVLLMTASDPSTLLDPGLSLVSDETSILPSLAHDEAGNLLLQWVETGPNAALRLLRFTPQRTRYAGWPDGGVIVKDASWPMSDSSSLVTMPPPLALPGGDGAIVGWSQDEGAGPYVYLRSVSWAVPP